MKRYCVQFWNGVEIKRRVVNAPSREEAIKAAASAEPASWIVDGAWEI